MQDEARYVGLLDEKGPNRGTSEGRQEEMDLVSPWTGGWQTRGVDWAAAGRT